MLNATFSCTFQTLWANLNSYSIKITCMYLPYFWHKNVKQTWSHLDSKKKVVIDTISMSFSTIVRTTTYWLNLKFAITANVIIRYPSHHRPPPLATAIDWLLSGWFLFLTAILRCNRGPRSGSSSVRLSLYSVLLNIVESCWVTLAELSSVSRAEQR